MASLFGTRKLIRTKQHTLYQEFSTFLVSFFRGRIVGDYPLLLTPARYLRSGDRALDPVDRPAVLGGVLLDQRMREHRQHELALDGGERFQQVLEVRIVERAVIMSAVSPDIGRIHEVERLRTVVALYDMGAVLALDGDVVQPGAQLGGELVLGVTQLRCGGAVAIVPEGAVYHRGEAELGADPHCPSPLDRGEVRRVLIDMPGVGVLLAGVQGRIGANLGPGDALNGLRDAWSSCAGGDLP